MACASVFSSILPTNATRLRKALKGKAKELVQHLLPHVSNVPVIMAALEKRFGQPRYILEALSQKVKECPAPATNKPETIINLDIAVKSLVATITATKNPLFLNNMELVNSLVKKLPPEMCEQWHMFMISNNRLGSLTDFSDWLSMKADLAMMRVEPTKSEVRHEKEEKKPRPKRGPGSINATSGEDEKLCPACKKSHLLRDCWKFQKMSLNDKWEFIKETKPSLCVCCLKPGHRAFKCPDAKKCGVSGCDKRHSPLLHSVKNPTPPPSPAIRKKEEPVVEPTQNKGSVCVTMVNGEAVIEGCDGPLPIVPVILKGPLGTRRTYALLDAGASRSLIAENLAESIGLHGEDHAYSYESVSGNKVTEANAKKVDCEVAGVYRGAHFYPLRRAVTVSSLRMRPYSMKTEEIKACWPHLKKVKGKNLVNVVPEVIIGSNNPTLILARELAVGPPEGPVGWKTPLGWTIAGDFDEVTGRREGSINTTSTVAVTDEYLHELIKSSFSTENFGVVQPQRKGVNKAEQCAYRILEATTKKIGNCWETGLLWKMKDNPLPESYDMALCRLRGIERKMKKNPEFAVAYCQKFEEYLEKGYIRKLTAEEVKAGNTRTWYIPHFAVTNPNKPGKTRLVFDAAAKANGVSLNDALSSGPDLIRPLTACLWNFRGHKYALTRDISDMFHRVKVIQEDQPSQRFLWRDGDTSREPDHYAMEVLIFGATSSPCSAIYVKNVNAMEHANQMEDSAYSIVEDFYVDDCLTGAATPQQLIQIREEISYICEAGGFQVCKFTSNCKEVIESIPEDLRAEGVRALKEKEILPAERVLGLWWDPTEDVFQFKLGLHKVPRRILEGAVPTKRDATSVVMSLFDPLGLVNHFKIKGIMLLQRTWIAGIGWDEEFPDDIYQPWIIWLKNMENITQVRVPRFYGMYLNLGEIVELHIFVDASQEAFEAVAYLRIVRGCEVKVVLFGSKARVAPLKKLTIPRMELQAALLGARLADSICSEVKWLRGKRRIFWSDSRTALSWIRSDAGKFKEFVANRVGEVHETTNPNEWKWVPTKENPADLATRFETQVSFEADDVWFTGPGFLWESESEWPKEPSNTGIVASTLLEDGSEEKQKSSKTKACIQPLIPMENFSALRRLVRKVSTVRKIFLFWRNKALSKKTEDEKQAKHFEKRLDIIIGPEDYDAAIKVLVRWTQQDAFGAELNQLEKETTLKNEKIAKLSPILLDGLLCLKSRLVNAKIPDQQKYPMILPARHHFTDLLILAEHERLAHQGQETVLNELRKRFWIVDGRQSVLRVVRNCGLCRLKMKIPVMPEMGALPDYRLAAYQPPFTFTGVDFFGPIQVTVGRRHEKRYGVIFTCLVTRAIHLEVAHGLSTDEAMMALSRFIDSRGRPNTIYSDNGTNFVGASKELKAAAAEIDFDKIAGSGKFGPINWRFNPPAAPHFGGAWERLIKSVKKCLYSILNEQYPRDTTLLTAIKSVENIVNSRPLTHVSSDPTDERAITPNDILRGGSDVGPTIPAEIDPDDDYIRDQWRRAHLLADQFWRKWSRDYLPKLMTRSKWHSRTEPIQVGDLVFLVDEQLPRNKWKRGYISNVMKGADQQVRAVDVTTTDGDKKTTYKRSVAKVCPIGLRMEIPGSQFQKSGAGMLLSECDAEDEKGHSPVD